jgi:DedD protein
MMERRAKERLIGASVLVALIVLIVPELLSGPKPVAPAPEAPRLPAAASTPEPIRTVTVDLATSKAPANPEPDAGAPPASASAPAVMPAPAPEPAASHSPPAAAPSAAASTLAVESAALPPTSKAGSAHGDVSRSAGWAVQLGSFASRANADNLVHQLKAQGFAVYILSGGSGGATRHRVRVGPLGDREAAERTAAKLKALGHQSSLVSPGA